MKGKKIVIQLHTPILMKNSKEDEKESRPRAVQELAGIVLEVNEAGITLDVTEAVDEKSQKFSPPYRKIFLPQHKIDHGKLLN